MKNHGFYPWIFIQYLQFKSTSKYAGEHGVAGGEVDAERGENEADIERCQKVDKIAGDVEGGKPTEVEGVENGAGSSQKNSDNAKVVRFYMAG